VPVTCPPDGGVRRRGNAHHRRGGGRHHGNWLRNSAAGLFAAGVRAAGGLALPATRYIARDAPRYALAGSQSGSGR
jgi:hypothetical protein